MLFLLPLFFMLKNLLAFLEDLREISDEYVSDEFDVGCWPLSDSNEIGTNKHLVRKRTLNLLPKLAK